MKPFCAISINTFCLIYFGVYSSYGFFFLFLALHLVARSLSRFVHNRKPSDSAFTLVTGYPWITDNHMNLFNCFEFQPTKHLFKVIDKSTSTWHLKTINYHIRRCNDFYFSLHTILSIPTCAYYNSSILGFGFSFAFATNNDDFKINK